VPIDFPNEGSLEIANDQLKASRILSDEAIARRNRLSSIPGHCTGYCCGYIPWRICRWHFEASLAGIYLFRLLGVFLITVGLPILLDSFARFAFQGLGTPAPIFPTRHLVVSGLYRYLRNPMYVAVVWLILGQGLFFGDVVVLKYGIAVWTAFHLFVLIYEEPNLRSVYGSEYEDFCTNVRRWIPRMRPWSQNRENN